MTIFKNSLITLGLAVLGFSAVFVISVLVFMNSLYYEINITSLRDTARALMTAIGNDRVKELFLAHDDNNPAEIIFPLNITDAYRLTLIAPSGFVLWDSYVTERLVNHIDREEVAAALEGREGSSRRDSITTGMRRIYYAIPVFGNNGNVTGVFRLSFSIPEFVRRVSSIIIPFIIFICLFIAAAFWAIVMYSRSLSSSLGRLVSIAQASANVVSDPEAIDHVAPEFRSLERALRAMTVELNLRFEQAKAEGSRFAAILDGMSDAVFAMDNALRLHLVNPKARALFNLEDSDINSMTLLEATHSTELVETARKAITASSPLETELVFYSGPGGSKHEQQFQVYASTLENGGVILVLKEVTQLVRLERIRKDFVSNVSHELRTPIQLIKGFSETLHDTVYSDRENTAQIIHFIEIIRKNAGNMENLVSDLLNLANLENAGLGSYDMKEQNVSFIIEEAVSSMELQAKVKQIEIVAEYPEGLTAVLYSPFIVQGLINLIDNSIKYSPPNSKIWVSAAKSDEDIVFQVRDTGIGIPPEHLERIFERFYRVDRARSREAGGTGLGLSIVRHIALLHKGTTEVESRAGEGSVFRIRIPQSAVSQPAANQS
ncbi:MAG: ATP-binding protein [Treponema sp.]|nr:ATP-binding protein [Treponema sp.]